MLPLPSPSNEGRGDPPPHSMEGANNAQALSAPVRRVGTATDVGPPWRSLPRAWVSWRSPAPPQWPAGRTVPLNPAPPGSSYASNPSEQVPAVTRTRPRSSTPLASGIVCGSGADVFELWTGHATREGRALVRQGRQSREAGPRQHLLGRPPQQPGHGRVRRVRPARHRQGHPCGPGRPRLDHHYSTESLVAVAPGYGAVLVNVGRSVYGPDGRSSRGPGGATSTPTSAGTPRSSPRSAPHWAADRSGPPKVVQCRKHSPVGGRVRGEVQLREQPLHVHLDRPVRDPSWREMPMLVRPSAIPASTWTSRSVRPAKSGSRRRTRTSRPRLRGRGRTRRRRPGAVRRPGSRSRAPGP